MITVGYYIKNQTGQQYKQFSTMVEAQAFMLALHENPNCDAYGIVRG